jgi:two-component system sensor histidine kinase KdpD
VIYAAISSLPDETPSVVLDLPEVLPPVVADAGLLERALANVLANAQMWSPPDRPVRVVAGVAGGRVDVFVIDQGPGIAADQKEKVVQPFQRLGDSGQSPAGIGLGLAVAKGFAEAMGSDLVIDDTPGGGTTIVLSLRRAEE